MDWVILCLISAFFASLSSILSKKVMTKEINANQILFEKYLLTLIVCLVIFGNFISFSSFFNNWNLYILKALTIGIFGVFYLKMLEEYDISVVSPLLNLSPIFLLLLSSVFLSEHPTIIQVFAIFIILIGTYILEMTIHFPHIEKLHKIHFSNFTKLKKYNWKFVGTAFFLLLIISICAMTDKMIFIAGVNVYTNMYYTAFFVFIALVVYLILKKEISYTIKNIYDSPSVIIISSLNLLSTFFILKAIANPLALVSLVVPIKRTSTLFSSIFGGFIFHENHLMKKFFGVTIMLFGVFLITL